MTPDRAAATDRGAGSVRKEWNKLDVACTSYLGKA